MKQRVVFFSVVVVLLGLLWSGSSQATIIVGFTPVTQQESLGSQAVVDLFISGLGDHTAPSLGAFDLDVTFDPSILSLFSAAFGNQLDLGISGSLQGITPGTGSVELSEISLEDPSALLATQPGSFTLATLTFDTLAVGTSPLNMSINVLEDETGSALSATVPNGSVSVVAGAVPEPSTILLLGAGLAGVGLLRRRFKK